MQNNIEDISIEAIEEEYGLSDGEAFIHYLNNFHINIKDVEKAHIEEFEDSFRGRFYSIEEYALERAEQCGMLDDVEFLRKYFDHKSFANDLVRGGEIWTEESTGDLLIFEAW
jgi:antirestriction protein